MAEIGRFGDIRFSVSAKQVKTIQALTWNSSARWGEHQRIGKEPLLEYMGPDTETITILMYFSVFSGTEPMDEMVQLLEMERRGDAGRLVIGSHTYGKNLWVIASSSRKMEYFDKFGTVIGGSVQVVLKSYPKRQ